MNAKTITGKNPEDIRSALEEAAKDGLHPTLGMVFVPSHFDFEGIEEVLDEHAITIFGANTPDKFTDQGMENDAATILLMDLNPAQKSIRMTTMISLGKSALLIPCR